MKRISITLVVLALLALAHAEHGRIEVQPTVVHQADPSAGDWRYSPFYFVPGTTIYPPWWPIFRGPRERGGVRA